MAEQIGYHAINMSGTILTVKNENGSTIIGHIYPKERFVVLDCWLANAMEYTNVKIKFLNSSGNFVYGYIFNIPPGHQIDSWGQWSFGYLESAYSIFYIDAPTNIYDGSGNFVRTMQPGEMVASANCENGSTYAYFMSIDYAFYAGATDAGWTQFNGFIDTKVNINSTNTPVYGNWN